MSTKHFQIAFYVSQAGRLSLLSQVLQEWQTDDQYKRIIIKKGDIILGLRESFQALSIRMPDDFYGKIEDDFTLFIYSQSQGNRLGFVAEVIDRQGLTALLKSRELTIENDFEIFFGLMGSMLSLTY